MKKFICILVCLILLVGCFGVFTACGDDDTTHWVFFKYPFENPDGTVAFLPTGYTSSKEVKHGGLVEQPNIFLDYESDTTNVDDELITLYLEQYEGRHLVGWYKDREYTEIWDFSKDRVYTDNMILYARFYPGYNN